MTVTQTVPRTVSHVQTLGRELARSPGGLIGRRQLQRLGIDRFGVRNQVAARRWVVLTPRVIGTTTGALTLATAVLARRSARRTAQHARRPHSGRVARSARLASRPRSRVLVDDELNFEPVDGCPASYRTRRPFDASADRRGRALPRAGSSPPSCSVAGYQRSAGRRRASWPPPSSSGSPRRPTPRWVEQLRPLRRASMFRRTLGRHRRRRAVSGAEIDVRPPVSPVSDCDAPDRQRPATDRAGRSRCDRLRVGPRRRHEFWCSRSTARFHMEVAALGGRPEASSADSRPATAIVVRCTAYESPPRDPPRSAATCIASASAAVVCLRRAPERVLRHTTRAAGQDSRTTTAEAMPASWESERWTWAAPSSAERAATVPRDRQQRAARRRRRPPRRRARPGRPGRPAPWPAPPWPRSARPARPAAGSISPGVNSRSASPGVRTQRLLEALDVHHVDADADDRHGAVSTRP